jgi:hypothetical protein
MSLELNCSFRFVLCKCPLRRLFQKSAPLLLFDKAQPLEVSIMFLYMGNSIRLSLLVTVSDNHYSRIKRCTITLTRRNTQRILLNPTEFRSEVHVGCVKER